MNKETIERMMKMTKEERDNLLKMMESVNMPTTELREVIKAKLKRQSVVTIVIPSSCMCVREVLDRVIVVMNASPLMLIKLELIHVMSVMKTS